MRASRITWSDKVIELFFYYDGEISDEDEESAQCAATEVISDFPGYELKVHVLRWDYPKCIPQEGELVYIRREPNPNK